MIALQRFVLGVARGQRLVDFLEDFPDQADLIQDIALVLAALVIVPLLWMGWLVVAGAFDLFSTVERQGVVVRARRPQRVVPFPGACSARSPAVTASPCSSPSTTDGPTASAPGSPTSARRYRQGARARVKATPVLGYVRRSEPIGTTPG